MYKFKPGAYIIHKGQPKNNLLKIVRHKKDIINNFEYYELINRDGRMSSVDVNTIDNFNFVLVDRISILLYWPTGQLSF
jgi:hypothetical protein